MLGFFPAEDYKIQTERQFAGFFPGLCADSEYAGTGLWDGAELRWLKLLSIGSQKRVTSLRGNKMSKGKGQSELRRHQGTLIGLAQHPHLRSMVGCWDDFDPFEYFCRGFSTAYKRYQIGHPGGEIYHADL